MMGLFGFLVSLVYVGLWSCQDLNNVASVHVDESGNIVGATRNL